MLKKYKLCQEVRRPAALPLILATVALFAWGLLWTPARCSAQSAAAPLDHALEAALLAETWPQVATLLKDVTPRTPSPVLRLLKGHACLAVNRNNESLCLFLSLNADNDKEAWLAWAKDFAGRHPQNPTAHYLHGDALARLTKWDQSLEAFNKSLKINKHYALSLHGKGVVHAALWQLEPARENLREATKISTSCAEFYNSYATYILQRKTDPQKALKWFERALKISPHYILSLNGIGSSKTLLREWDEASTDLATAMSLAKGCLGEMKELINLNIYTLNGERNKAMDRLLTKIAGIKPGMSVEEKISILDKMSPNDRQKTFDVLKNAADYNRGKMGSFLTPAVEVGIKGGLKGSVLGPQPYIEGEITGKFDTKKPAEYNLGQQEQLMKTMGDRYGISGANKISILGALGKQHILPGSQYGPITNPKGVSTREISEDSLQTRNWNVFAVYGLLYKIKTK